MRGKITVYQLFVVLCIAGIAFGFGVWRGEQNQIQNQVKIQTDTQKKVAWDIEVKKPETKEVTVDQWEIVKMNVSAYCPCEKCCDNWGKIPVSSGKRKTASGHTIKEGDKFVAAPRNYPFGTKMIIEGYAGDKIVKVEDVGGAIKGNKLDLYFDSHQLALNFGRQEILVKVKKVLD